MQKKLFLLSAVIFIVACGENPKPQEITPAANKGEYGVDIFRKNCVSCHGAEGNMGVNGAADLTKSTLSLDERVATITNGRKVMLPFKQLLSAEEIAKVAAYTESLKKQ